MIEKLNPNSNFNLYLQVAEIHIAAIHHGVLPMLGQRLLARVYRQLTKDRNACIWVAIEDNKVIGFLSGTINVTSSFIKILLSPTILIYTFFSGFYFSRAALTKIPAIFTYLIPAFLAKNKDLPSVRELNSQQPELLSIAVDTNFQGQGLGKTLVMTFENWLSENEIKSYRVTTNIEEVNSNFFYRNMGFIPTLTKAHHALILQVYEKQIEI